MVLGSRIFRGGYSKALIIFFVIMAVLGRGYVLVADAEQKSTVELNRYRVFTLKNISAERGKKFLADANIGTVSQLPGSNTLLVTAQPAELIKASAILGTIDSKEEFVMRKLAAASEAGNLPSKGKIASMVGGDISIGSFSEPPIGAAKTKAIIDVHNDAVVVIAEADKVEKIISAIERLKEAEAKTSQPAELPKPSEPNRPAPVPGQTGQALKDMNIPKTGAGAEVKSGAVGEKVSAGDSESDRLLGLLDRAEKTTAGPAGRRKAESKEPNVAPVSGQKIVMQPPAGAEQPQTKLEGTSRPVEKPQILPEVAEVNKAEQVAAGPSPEGETPLVEKRYGPQLPAAADETLQLDLPEKLNIIDLLDLMGKYLHLDYVYDAAEMAGKEVSLKVQGPIKVRDLYPLAESVMKFKGFVMTRKGNLVTITTRDKALDIDPAFVSAGLENVQLGDGIVSRIYDLKYMASGDAKSLLDGMRIGVAVTAIPGSKKIIITGYTNLMARVDELLGVFDSPGEPKQFKYRQLKYTMAKLLAGQIKTLVEKLGGNVSLGAISTSAPSPPPGRPARQAQPSPPQPSASSAPMLSVYLDFDERTNRILMIGLKSELDVVNGLIEVLDVAQQDLRTLRLYEIQHVGADDVKNKLAELGIISGGAGAAAGSRITRKGGAQQPAQPQPAPAAAATEGPVEEPQVIVIESTNSLLVNATDEQHNQIAVIIGYTDSETLQQAIPYEIYSLENQNPTKLAEVLNKLIQETVKDKEGKIEKVIKKEEDIVIVPDENTFSIVVYASRKNQEWIKKLIKSLDKRRPQVLLDATLVEISEDDAFNYDLQLVSKFPRLESGGTMDKLTALKTPFPTEGVVTEATSILGDASPAQGFYAGRHIQALLKLMQKKGYGRVLARPKILVNDNEKGHIDTTNTIYIARSASTVQVNVAGGGTPISTSYTFDQFPSGIKLDITPHISEGSLLRLEIKMTRSSQAPPAGTAADLPPGTKTENNVETVVTVPDDSTIILGGITTLDQSKTNWKVPLLGDIPIVGGLFRRIGNSSSQKKLYVFVKANILRPSDVAGLPDLQRMSDRNRGAVEDFEERFQEHQDWPGIKPEPIEPLRVLESE